MAAEQCKADLAHVKQYTLDSTYLTKQHVTWIPPLPPAATLLGTALARSAFPAQLQCLLTWQPAAPESAAEACWAQPGNRHGVFTICMQALNPEITADAHLQSER